MLFLREREAFSALNDLLLGKLANATSDVERIAVNATVGVLDVFDVAAEFGMENRCSKPWQ